jgi:hypothetical protein
MISARKLSLRSGLSALAAIAALTVAAAPGVAQAAGTPRPVARWAVGGFLAHAPAAPTLPDASAAPAAVAGPAKGLAPAVAWDGTAAFLFYTGSDGRAYQAPVSPPVTASTLGGRFIGGPGAAFVPGTGGGVALFGRGTTNMLYVWNGGTSWVPLGGNLTSRPGVAAGTLGSVVDVDVAVRGGDGSVWVDHLTPTTATWIGLGGQVLAGTAPTAVNVGGTLYVLVVGLNHAVWDRSTTDGSNWTAWASLGGGVRGELGAATPSAGAGIVYARAGNALWYNEFAGTTTGVTPGWHSLGGGITSGVGAGSVGDGINPTWAVALGGNGHIWANSGVWPATAWAQAF